MISRETPYSFLLYFNFWLYRVYHLIFLKIAKIKKCKSLSRLQIIEIPALFDILPQINFGAKNQIRWMKAYPVSYTFWHLWNFVLNFPHFLTFGKFKLLLFLILIFFYFCVFQFEYPALFYICGFLIWIFPHYLLGKRR